MFTDDLTGDVLTQDEVQTVTFAGLLTGRAPYEIDLSEKNMSSLRYDFAAWIEHARRATGPKTTVRTATTGAQRASTGPGQSTKIREWAQANGHTGSTRGQVSARIIDAYNAAH